MIRPSFTLDEHKAIAIETYELELDAYNTATRLGYHSKARMCDLWLRLGHRIQALRIVLDTARHERFADAPGGYFSLHKHGGPIPDGGPPARPPVSEWLDPSPLPPRLRPPLSRASHELLGARVSHFRVALNFLLVRVCRALGSSHPATSAVRRASRALSELASHMDALACGQHPDWAEAHTVYYGQATHELTIAP